MPSGRSRKRPTSLLDAVEAVADVGGQLKRTKTKAALPVVSEPTSGTCECDSARRTIFFQKTTMLFQGSFLLFALLLCRWTRQISQRFREQPSILRAR